MVEVSVDWDKVSNALSEQFSKQSAKVKENQATEFGVRIVYLSDNNVFSQSVENINGDTSQLVTLDIPTADIVAVYVASITTK